MPQIANLIAGRYRPVQVLGTGGMGAVYRAVDLLNGGEVALKRVLTLSLPGHTGSQERLALAREFRLLATLRHPNVIGVIDYGFDEEGEPFYTMELLDEPRDILAAAEGLTLAGRVMLFVQLLQALAYLHRRGVIHRDLKPGNALVTGGGTLKVLDFGLARTAEQSENPGMAGTLMYMAPEVMQYRRATPAADLYAAGLLAYQMFTGQYPFDASSTTALIEGITTGIPNLAALERVASGEPIVPRMEYPQQYSDTIDIAALVRDARRDHIPAAPQPIPSKASADLLVYVVGRLLMRNPEDRYPDAEAAIHDLYTALDWPVPQPSADIRESFLQAAQFVGRDAEFARLTAALDQARAGKGGTWLVGGESGVGKSRLLAELRAQALVTDVVVLRGQGVAGAGLPYHLWREPLRRLALICELDDLEAGVLKEIVPDIEVLVERKVPDAPRLDGEAARQRLLETIVAVVERGTEVGERWTPLLVILEDLQWAVESLDPLRQLISRAPRLPMLVVGSYRDDERPTLPEVLPGIRVLRLKRLSRAAIAALSESMLGRVGKSPPLLELMEHETEGNVFYLIEIVRALTEEAGGQREIAAVTLPPAILSGGMRTIMQRRLNRVPESNQPLLKLAAVAGRELDERVLEEAAPDADLEAWRMACAEAAVLEVHEGRWRFSHDRLREAVLDSLAPDERPVLHRRVAHAIETVYSDRVAEFSGILAHHYHAAGETRKERRYAVLAGQHELNSGSNTRAEALFNRALLLIPGKADPKTQREAAFIMLLLGQVYVRLNKFDQAARIYAASRDTFRALGDRNGVGQALIGMGSAAYFGPGDYDGAMACYEEALAIHRVLGERDMEAVALNSIGVIAVARRQYDRARRVLSQALAICRKIDYPGGMARNLLDLGNLLLAEGRHVEAERHYLQAIAVFEDMGDPHGVAVCCVNLAETVAYLKQFQRARTYIRRTALSAIKTGDGRMRVAAVANYAYVLEQAGNLFRAAEINSMVLADGGIDSEARATCEKLAARLRTQLPADDYAAASERGRRLRMDAVLDAILNDH